MARNSLETFIERTTATNWDSLTSEMVARCRNDVEELLKASISEEWLAELHRSPPETKELYRDPTHGFLLLAHAEPVGLYRPPHDHGRGWAIYGVQRGESEMGTYIRTQDSNGRVRLVKRETTRMRAGQVMVFLPGDIHDTRCSAGPQTLFRFTDRNLKTEAQITRYVQQDGDWTVKAA